MDKQEFVGKYFINSQFQRVPEAAMSEALEAWEKLSVLPEDQRAYTEQYLVANAGKAVSLGSMMSGAARTWPMFTKQLGLLSSKTPSTGPKGGSKKATATATPSEAMAQSG